MDFLKSICLVCDLNWPHGLSIYHREHDDRNALTPGSARRGPSPLVSSTSAASSRLRPELHQNNHNHNGGIVMHVDLDQQREELFLCWNIIEQ